MWQASVLCGKAPSFLTPSSHRKNVLGNVFHRQEAQYDCVVQIDPFPDRFSVLVKFASIRITPNAVGRRASICGRRLLHTFSPYSVGSCRKGLPYCGATELKLPPFPSMYGLV